MYENDNCDTAWGVQLFANIIFGFAIFFHAFTLRELRQMHAELEQRVILRANLALEDVRENRDEIALQRLSIEELKARVEDTRCMCP